MYRQGITQGYEVLIDTQWNVNHVYIFLCISVGSFNRYIVECKYKQIASKIPPEKVLIDTQWNVNFYDYSMFNLLNDVLIDTQWNVNEKPRQNVIQIEFVLIDTQWNVNLLNQIFKH